MAETVATQENTDPDRKSSRIFLRLLRLLRPYWGLIALGLLLLFLSVPGELFPALVWKYVTDDLILQGHSQPTPVLPWLFSLNGRIHQSIHLLFSCIIWLFLIYESGELFGTLSTNVMNRVAQKFI